MYFKRGDFIEVVLPGGAGTIRGTALTDLPRDGLAYYYKVRVKTSAHDSVDLELNCNHAVPTRLFDAEVARNG